MGVHCWIDSARAFGIFIDYVKSINQFFKFEFVNGIGIQSGDEQALWDRKLLVPACAVSTIATQKRA